MTGKPKPLVFVKSENCKYHSIDEVINKLQPYNYVNVIVNVIGMSKINKIRNLSLKEFLVTTDDGVTFINITMFEDLISLLEINKCYKIKNLQLATYLNQKKFKSTPLTCAEPNEPLEIADLSLQTTAPQESYKTETVMFHSIDDESLVTRLACNKCGEIINDTSSKIFLCKNCQSRQLRINQRLNLAKKCRCAKKILK